MRSEEIATLIGSILAILGALCIIIIYLYFKETKIFYRKLIFVLSVYDLLQSLTFVLPGQKGSGICRTQFTLVALFATTSQYWSAAISILSYLKVVKSFHEKFLHKLYIFFHIFMWVTVTPLFILSFFLPNPNKSGTYWCISTSEKYLIPLYAFNWFYLLVCLVFCILIFIRLKKFYQQNIKGNYNKRISQLNKFWIELRMSFVPLIYIIIFIPTSFRRIRNLAYPNASEITFIDVLQGLLSISQGFWDFLIFVIFDPEIRTKLTKKIPQKNQSFEKISSFQNFTENNINESLIGDGKNLTEVSQDLNLNSDSN
ncbi:g protein-coupled receptor [Anaeramoeba ignava]|uniref:G protein-coupled receptor n=1 Tax=Anaeramoeba ignava TaxID=1746090 RepID=A0A9Q0LT37_ANAIG|nr:g protein-coupled receptor [Anaeramoeba ignava]